MTERRGFYLFGDAEITTISDYENGEYLDTRIYIHGSYICTIEGNKIAECIGKLQEIINTHRI